MKPSLFNKTLSTLLILMTFISCSDGGIGGSGISVGPISDFGSVFVNDVEFDTRQAVIHLNGIPAKEAELRIGMIVTVHGTFHSDGLT